MCDMYNLETQTVNNRYEMMGSGNQVGKINQNDKVTKIRGF